MSIFKNSWGGANCNILTKLTQSAVKPLKCFLI